MPESEGAGKLIVDTRWHGRHGIARYSTEVVARFDSGWTPLRASGRPSSALDVFRHVRVSGPRDIVYSPGYNAAVGAKVPQFVTIHDLIHLETSGLRRPLFEAYYEGILKPTVKRAGLVFTVSETSRSVIRRWIDDDAVDVVNAGIGVSAAFTEGGPSHHSPQPYAMYVGNMRRHKNVDVLFHALRRSPLLLTMLIPRNESEIARRAARSAGVGDRVTIVHDLSDEELAAHYRGAAVTAMPSTLEGFGLPPLESIMCGTPVAYWSGCDAVAETVGARGVTVHAAGSPAEWADALDASARMGRVAAPAPGRFDWDSTAARVHETLVARL